MSMDYKKEFQEWTRKGGLRLFDNLSDVMDSEVALKVGDKVMLTNDYGVTFGPYEVLGFCKPDKWGNCVYLNKSSYWYANRVDQLMKL